MDVLATIGSGYATALTGIADRAYEIAHYLAGVFIILMIGLAALEAMFGQMHIKPFFFGIAFAMIYVFIMKNALPISEGMVRVPVQIGLRLAGIGGSAADFLASPDKLFYQGMGIVQNLWDAGYETCKDTQFIGCFGGLNMPSPILWAIASVMFGFLIGGVSIFCAAFGIKLIVFLGLIILPMAIFAPTAMFGKGPIRGAMYSCMFLMVLTASLGLTTMAYTRISADATGLYEWGKALPFIGTAVIFAGLILFAHIIAKSVADGGMAVGSALVTGPTVRCGRPSWTRR